MHRVWWEPHGGREGIRCRGANQHVARRNARTADLTVDRSRFSQACSNCGSALVVAEDRAQALGRRDRCRPGAWLSAPVDSASSCWVK